MGLHTFRNDSPQEPSVDHHTVCQKCNAAVKSTTVYDSYIVNSTTHGYTNSEPARTGRNNALVAFLIDNGAKKFGQMGLYYKPTTEKLDWVPMLEVYKELI